MKQHLTKLFFYFLFFISGHSANAQDLTGIWRGYFNTESGDQYKVELQIEQNSAHHITGVSYSYLTTVFYGKALLAGNYNQNGKNALIQETKTVEVKMSGGSVTCIMNYMLNYAQSGKEEFLEGTFTSAYEQTDAAMGVKRGGNCGGGKIFLRKVTTSDFYVEPFLRTNPAFNKPDKPAPPKTTTAINKPNVTHAPTTKATPPVTKKPAAKKPAQQPLAKKNTPKPTIKQPTAQTITIKRDTTHKISMPPVAVQEAPKKELPRPSLTIPPTFRNRENNVIQTLNVTGDQEVTIKIYDNGEIDDDTVSVYLDNKLILGNKRISASPLIYTFKVTEAEPEHTVTMVAENLGRIPPNTSLMLVYIGGERYEVYISTNEQKNAVIRFRYKKSD